MFRTPYLVTSRSISSTTRRRRPETVAVGLGAQPHHLLARLEWRLDAAERTPIGTAQRRVNRGVRLALEIAEAMPVVGAVARHRQQIPRDAPHVGIEVLDERRRGIANRVPVIPIHQATNSREIGLRARLERHQQVDDRVKRLIARHKIARFVGERALGQRRDVSAKHQQGYVGIDVLDGGRKRRRARHVLRRRRWLMTVDHDCDENRREGFDADGGLLGRQLVSFRIDNFDGESFGAHERGNETSPYRVLNRGQPLAERLVDSRAAAWVNENEIRASACSSIDQ